MKYKIFKFENSLGEIWYQIKTGIRWSNVPWIFSCWIRESSCGEYIYDPPKRFNTEEECLTYIEREKEDLRQKTLRKQIKITGVKYDI